MTKKYPLTYEEYEKKVTELFLNLYPENKREIAKERLNNLLKNEHDFIEGLYAETCFRYDHPEIYTNECKNIFQEDSLKAIPVNTLNMVLGGNV